MCSDAENQWQCEPSVSRSNVCSPRPLPTRVRLVTYSLSCLIAFTCSSINSSSSQLVNYANNIQNKTILQQSLNYYNHAPIKQMALNVPASRQRILSRRNFIFGPQFQNDKCNRPYHFEMKRSKVKITGTDIFHEQQTHQHNIYQTFTAKGGINIQAVKLTH